MMLCFAGVAAVFLIWQLGVADAFNDAAARGEAYATARDEVLRRLVSPATAEFPGLWDDYLDHVALEHDGTFRVSSYVDSQNRFGALVRTAFDVRLRREPDGAWSVLDVDIAAP